MSDTKMILAAKGSYELSVGLSSEDGKSCYILTNLDTGVEEVETKILPQGYQYLNDLDGGLKEAIIDFAQATTITPVTSIH